MPSGGYRKPGSPAPVSGPGSLSRRTDGQVKAVPTGLDYGDAKALHAQESTAPMAATPDVPPADVSGAASGPPGGAGPLPSVTPIGAPTQRPDEPITHGVDIGPGGGSDVLPVEHQPQFVQQGPMTQMLAQLSARATTGVLAALYANAQAQGA